MGGLVKSKPNTPPPPPSDPVGMVDKMKSVVDAPMPSAAPESTSALGGEKTGRMTKATTMLSPRRRMDYPTIGTTTLLGR
jgi:hypothetical protein